MALYLCKYAQNFCQKEVAKEMFLKITPRSCDFTQLDYYLWSAVKDKSNADKPEAIDALKDNIREAIGEIQLHTIDNVLKN